MGNTLLIVPPGVRPESSIGVALDIARREGGSLVAVIVLDPTETARIAATLDSAFMGERVSDRVAEVLAHEQRCRADTLLQVIGEKAREAGIDFVPLVEEGDPGQVCSRIVPKHHVASAVLAVERRSWLARFLSRSAKIKLPAVAGCEVNVVEEDEPGKPES